MTTPARIILVAIDTSPHSLAALESAAKLAARLNAELRGMYVEDIDMLRMAELPFACTITSFGEARPLTRDTLELQLQRQADIARHAMESVGARLHVAWSFSVVRGAVTREISQAASSAEIVTVGRTGWSRRGGTQLGSVVLSLLEEGKSSLFMVERNGLDGPFAVIYDGSPASVRALKFAGVLAADHAAPVNVLLVNPSPELRSNAEKQLREDGIQARFETAGGDQTTLVRSLRQSGARTILMPGSVYSNAVQAAMILEDIKRSVLVVR